MTRTLDCRSLRSVTLAALVAAAVGSLTPLADAAPKLLIMSSTRIVYEINPLTGVSTQLITLDSAPGTSGELVYDCAANTYFLSSTQNDNLYTVNMATGATTLVGPYVANVTMHGLALDSSTGQLYGGDNGFLYAVDRNTGFAQNLGGGIITSFTNLGYDSRANIMYATNSNTDSFYKVNLTFGFYELIGPLNGPTNPHSLAYDKDTGLLYMADTGTDGLFIMDVATGTAHRVANIPNTNILGMCYVPDTCTEPSVPNGGGYVVPNAALAGDAITFNAIVLPVAGGTPSTGITVFANLTSVGGPAAVPMTAGAGNTFSLNYNLPASVAPGRHMVPLTISDAQSRTGSGTIVAPVRVSPAANDIVEVEPNDSRAIATPAEMTPGVHRIYGVSTGASTTEAGLNSADYYRVKTPAAAPGIYRHRLILTTSGAEGHTATIRGHSQSSGVINFSADSVAQTSSVITNPPRLTQWYGFGKREEINYRVGGAAHTQLEYLVSLETTPVTPLVVSQNFTPGGITIARAAGVTLSPDFVIYDQNFDPVSDFVSEGTSGLARTYAAGTYYMGISNVNTADNRATPVGQSARNSVVLDVPNAVTNNSTTAVSFTMTITDGANTADVLINKADPFELVWVKFTVGTPVSQRCQPADIATDDGTPLPADTGIHPNGGVNEGDYNSFFQGFFDAAPNCDIANDNGTPREPFGTNGVNGGVNEGDYNCFFQKFFDGCPA